MRRISKIPSYEILDPPGTEITDPVAQMKQLLTKPSINMDNMQVLNSPPINAPQIYRGHRKKWGRTYINILHDPRVVRGNTYAAFVIPSSLQMEFLRMKEEEEKRKKLARMPKKVPRCAYIGLRARRDDKNKKLEEEKKEDSPVLKPIENTGEVEDIPYFYADIPDAPIYVPLPPGKDEFTQIVDGELFDFDLEVKPILEVLVGRSVIQAQYELIEDYERDEYLKHKKAYERKREFELNKLQRTEAKYVRKEEEKQRRFKQKEQRKINDIIMQKKLMAKVFGKYALKDLKYNSFRQLQERGFLASHATYPVTFYLKNNYIPKAEKSEKEAKFIEDNLMKQIKKETDEEKLTAHENAIQKEKDRLYNIALQKALDKRKADKEEKQRRKEQLERREKRRINRITESITTNVINTKADRKDIMTLPLSDIDELTLKSESIHCFGQLGEIMFVIQEILNDVIPLDVEYKININDLMKKFLEEFLLNVVKEVNNDQFVLELKYLESPKYDFENIPEERRPEFAEFIKDERRYISKSVHELIHLGLLNKDIVNAFNEAVSDFYFKNPEQEKIEIDPENQDEAYQEEMKKKQEEAEKKAQDDAAKLELIRKKIKFTIIKPEVFKKKRENIGGFVTVEPNQIEKAIITESEEVPIKPPEEEKNEEGEEGEEGEHEEKQDEQKEEEKKEGEEEKKEVEEKKEGEEEKKEGEEEKKEVEEEKKEGEEEKKEGEEEKKEGENVPPQPQSKNKII